VAGWAQLGPFTIDTMTKASVTSGIALLFLLLVSPLLVRGLSAVDARLARSLLGPSVTGALTKRVDQLVTSRQRVVDSVEAERQRMERDLHDGAQQRLVSLAMTLGRARSRLGDSEPAVKGLIEEAHAEAMQAIAELRDLTRGLHPPVLTDRGLDAAVSAVAARAPVPVRVDVQVDPRPSLTIEAIAYFVVTEALTNVAKHAQAARAEVRIRRIGDVLRGSICPFRRHMPFPLRPTRGPPKSQCRTICPRAGASICAAATAASPSTAHNSARPGREVVNARPSRRWSPSR
jgi:signal transduction histidine kinase